MATGRKYIVLRAREIRELLTLEQQQQFLVMVEAISTKRQQLSPQKGVPFFFTLNTADKYAVPALEAYIQAIDADANTGNTGVQEARAAARAALDNAIMRNDGTKLPT